jgi:hypothetical protein
VEKIAIGAGLVLFATALLEPFLYQQLWILSIIPAGLIWILVLALATSSVISAFRDEHAEVPRIRAGLAFPLAIATVLLLCGLGVPSSASAWLHLQMHLAELTERERRAGGRPVAIDYLEGVPDGGAKIVRSRINPKRLPVAEHLRLTGERIHRCRKLTGRDWVCGYD